jgi:hypothetical protein
VITSDGLSHLNDPYARQPEVFPRLAPEMMARAIAYGSEVIRTETDASGGKHKSAYATALPGIFAVGDVRSGSVKRVASAV